MERVILDAAHTIPMFCRLNMQRRFNASIRPGEMHTLIFIKKAQKAVTPALISEFFAVTRPFVSKIINSLYEKGYIYKIPFENDNRSYRLELTKKGEQLLKEDYDNFLKSLGVMINKMGVEKFLCFLEMLKAANKILMDSRSDA